MLIKINNIIYASASYALGMIMPIIIGLLFLAVIVFAIRRKTLRKTGKLGEGRVSSVLQSMANKYGGYVFDNVILPIGRDGSTQIDHIYISPKAIFVIETKDYSGRIYGNSSQKEWTQVLAYGNEKHKFYNPLKQNETHVDALANVIDYNGLIYSCVVFPRADLSHLNCDYAFDIYNLKRFVNYVYRTNVREHNMEKSRLILQHFKDNPAKTEEEHVYEVQHRNALRESNFCPYCGIALVGKRSKSGRYFYGCPNYPKCKYTKSI